LTMISPLSARADPARIPAISTRHVSGALREGRAAGRRGLRRSRSSHEAASEVEVPIEAVEGGGADGCTGGVGHAHPG
jgi:hypothetical protein